MSVCGVESHKTVLIGYHRFDPGSIDSDRTQWNRSGHARGREREMVEEKPDQEKDRESGLDEGRVEPG